MSKKIQWIDAWKGLGIVTVVIGHVLPYFLNKYIFWFHMPLFFFISGYLYKEDTNIGKFVRKKFLHLLVPYFLFLLLLSIPEYLSLFQQSILQERSGLLFNTLKLTLEKLYGGIYLQKSFVVFWFITCLFFTQNFYNVIYCNFSRRSQGRWIILTIVVCGYIISIIDGYFRQGIWLPLNMNAVAISLPFYYLGSLFDFERLKNWHFYKFIVLAAIILFIFAIYIDVSLNLNLNEFSIKKTKYGLPIFNIIMAMSAIIVSQYFIVIFSKIKYLSLFLTEVGRASMMILYVHLPVIAIVFNWNKNYLLQIVLGLLIPYLLYKISCRFSWSRQFLLGDFR
jgi:fucose 4-O-acetylase-like acetyltransferase